MDEKKFSLELNENQMQLVKVALEEYFRIRMNQWNDLADSLTGKGIEYSAGNHIDEKKFNDFLIRRDCARCALESVGRMLWGPNGYEFGPKTEEELIAEDIWQVIRYTLWNERHAPGEDTWCVDSRKPMQCSKEPLPKCRRVDE